MGQDSKLQFRLCGRPCGDPICKQHQMGTPAQRRGELLYLLLIELTRRAARRSDWESWRFFDHYEFFAEQKKECDNTK
jgi:hypothetical protein